jgi:hypothetical protein
LLFDFLLFFTCISSIFSSFINLFCHSILYEQSIGDRWPFYSTQQRENRLFALFLSFLSILFSLIKLLKEYFKQQGKWIKMRNESLLLIWPTLWLATYWFEGCLIDYSY